MKNIDLTEGKILSKIMIVALPLVVTNLINMLYNITDMYWIAQYGSESVSAIGLAGLYIWLGQSVFLLTKLGTEIKVAQSLGSKKMDMVKSYAINGLVISVVLALTYVVFIFVFKRQLIDLFNIEDSNVISLAVEYLTFVIIGIFFILISQIFSSINNALANSKKVLIFISVGLLFNMILDPILINILDLGVKGAAIATTIAAGVSASLFIIDTYRNTELLKQFKGSICFDKIIEITKLGAIPAIQNITFTCIAMILTGIVAQYGTASLATMRLGNQIESITWMVGIGISTATSVYVGQNYGALKFERLMRGYFYILGIFTIYSVITSFVFILKGGSIFGLFTDDQEMILIGTNFLFIHGLMQVFQMSEQITVGLFNGIGKTNVPAVVSLIGNIARIPLALIFMKMYGVTGVWIAISITMFFKGAMMLCLMFLLTLKDNRFSLKNLRKIKGN